MEDIYVKMIINEKNRLKIPTAVLCEGIYTADMFYLVEHEKRSMDRITAKRLLARLGIDGGNYEHYLDWDEYNVWLKRMKLINSIEDGKLDLAEELLAKYPSNEDGVRNTSRANIEKQFCEFMKLQIMRKRNRKAYEDTARESYESVLKLTVPWEEGKTLEEMILSPLEANLLLEYNSRVYADKSIEAKLKMYQELLSSILQMPLGKLSLIKVYPKVVIYMYRSVADEMKAMNTNQLLALYKELWTYCTNALHMLRERKSLLYMMEVLEMAVNILQWFIDNSDDRKESERYCSERIEIMEQYNVLMHLYAEYKVESYITDDCYLYRESGIYCINEVARIRRGMLKMTREDLCDEDLSISTIKRLELMNKNINKAKFEKIFEKLSLYPSYVNMGIVSDLKKALDIFEEIRFMITSFRYEEVERLLKMLRETVPKHKLNEQVFCRIESTNEWQQGKITYEEHIQNLIEALEYTIKLENIQEVEKIFLTTEELTALFLISVAYKHCGKYEEALEWKKEIEKYCMDIEQQELVDGRIGIYEMIMEYIASLYGDVEKYDLSNHISQKLIKISLKLRRSGGIHPALYNIAWNNNQCKKANFSIELRKCIILSKLMGDTEELSFYENELTAYENHHV